MTTVATTELSEGSWMDQNIQFSDDTVGKLSDETVITYDPSNTASSSRATPSQASYGQPPGTTFSALLSPHSTGRSLCPLSRQTRQLRHRDSFRPSTWTGQDSSFQTSASGGDTSVTDNVSATSMKSFITSRLDPVEEGPEPPTMLKSALSTAVSSTPGLIATELNDGPLKRVCRYAAVMKGTTIGSVLGRLAATCTSVSETSKMLKNEPTGSYTPRSDTGTDNGSVADSTSLSRATGEMLVSTVARSIRQFNDKLAPLSLGFSVAASIPVVGKPAGYVKDLLSMTTNKDVRRWADSVPESRMTVSEYVGLVQANALDVASTGAQSTFSSVASGIPRPMRSAARHFRRNGSTRSLCPLSMMSRASQCSYSAR